MRKLIARYQHLLEWLINAGVFIYTIASILIVWKTLSKYGVNPWVFAFVESITSWGWAFTSVRVMKYVVDNNLKQARWWIVGAAISFVAPQAFLLVASTHAPRDVYRNVVIIVSSLFIFGIVSFIAEIRSKRKTVTHN